MDSSTSRDFSWKDFSWSNSVEVGMGLQPEHSDKISSEYVVIVVDELLNDERIRLLPSLSVETITVIFILDPILKFNYFKSLSVSFAKSFPSISSSERQKQQIENYNQMNSNNTILINNIAIIYYIIKKSQSLIVKIKH